jgi:hypothetical protein
MARLYKADSRVGLAVALPIVAVAMIVAAWLLLSGPAPVEIATEAAEAKASARQQALQDLRAKLDVDEQRHLALDPGILKQSQEICASQAGWGFRVCDAVAQHQVSAGMTPEQVRASWGKPLFVESVSPGRERWTYSSNAVEFENNLVKSDATNSAPSASPR